MIMNEKPKIFVIDDDLLNIESILDFMGKDYDVFGVKSCKNALAEAENIIPDIILLDIVMPDSNGYEICRVFKKSEIIKDIPVIFISGLNQVFDKVKAFDSGCVDYITKPFNQSELLSRVQTQIKLYHLHKELEQYKNSLEEKVKVRTIALENEIEKRKKMEEEKTEREKSLLRAQRLASLGSLSSAVAHEIRQPLQLIKMISDTILFRYKKKGNLDELDEKNYKNLEDLSKGVERINNIINNMQKLFKSSSDKIEFTRLNINLIIENLVKMYSQRLKNHFISLELILHPDVPEINGEEILLIQIISNIINNSIDAMDSIEKDNKKIIISTKLISGTVEILISDNASGIQETIKEKIFEPLFTTKLNNQNMGMGLFLVYNIVKSFDGSIDFFNNDMNGATFKICFNPAC